MLYKEEKSLVYIKNLIEKTILVIKFSTARRIIMAILSPSMLSADYMHLEQDLKATAASGAKWVHIDIMDGHFVPNLSFGYSMVKAIRPVTDMVLDVHLMIDTPIRYVDEFCKAGADWR